MEQQIQQHDWGATRLLNPDKQIDFLLNEGINPTNATLQSREYYKNTRKVQETFSKEDGTLDEKQFNAWYDNIALEYDYLKNIDVENFILDSYEKSISDFTTDFGKKKPEQLTVSFAANPLDQEMGGLAWNRLSDPEISKREAAQQNNYWDNELGAWSDKTINEAGALGLLTGKSLVYATYDEDVYDDNGRKIHNKGEWKVDEFGNFYAETAGNKENLNKQFVTLSEILTTDGSAWNKVDVFDSDDIKASIPKTVFRGVATVASMLIPYYNIGKSIALATAAINLTRTLPQITKTLGSFFDENVEFDTLNKWDNYMKKFRSSKSDYAMDHFFSFENVIDMAVDSFTQLAQQRAIAQIPEMFGAFDKTKQQIAMAQISTIMSADPKRQALLKNNPQLLENLVKAHPIYRHADETMKKFRNLSDIISKGYMIATSTEDSYNMARSYGFDTQTSSIISLATYVGIGMLFQNDYFRGMLTNTPDYDLQRNIKILVKQYLENNKEKIASEIVSSTSDVAKKSMLKNIGTSVVDFFKKHISDVKSGQFSIKAGMLSEAIEETIEEITQDTAIQIGKGWNSLKEFMTDKEYTDEYKYTDSDPLKRYATAFFGGAIGGGIFKVADRLHYQKSAYANWKNMLKDNSQISKEFVRYISQGHTDLILNELEKLKSTPIFSTSISGFNSSLDATDSNESQNSVMFNIFEKAIIDLDTFLGQKGLKINYDDFGSIEIAKGIRAELINSHGLQDSLFDDYLNIVNQISKEYAQLQELRGSKRDNMESSQESEIDSLIAEKTKLINNLTDQVRTLIKGEDDSYIGRLTMQLNPTISEALLDSSKDGLAQKYYGTNFDNLSDVAKHEIESKYKRIKDSGKSEMDYYELWNLYKQVHSDEELKTLIQNHSKKASGVDARTTGMTLSDYGRLIPKKIDNTSELQDKNILYALTKFITDVCGLQVAPGTLSTIFDVQLSEDQPSMELVLDSMYFDDIFSILDQTIDAINERSKAIENGLEPESLSKNISLIADKFNNDISLIEQFKTELQKYFEDDGSITSTNSFNHDAKVETAAIIDRFQNLLGDQFDNIWSLIASEQQASVSAGKDYIMSEDVENKLNLFVDFLSKIEVLLSGAHTDFKSSVQGIPFGANNFLNDTFKDKEIQLELMQIDGNDLTLLLNDIDDIRITVGHLLTKNRENRSDIFNEDRYLFLNLAYSKIDQIKSLIDSKVLLFDLELPEISRPDINNLSSEDAEEIASKARQFILNFELAFSNFFLTANESSINDQIQKIIAYLNHDLSIDTSHLVSGKNADIFGIIDFFHYLIRVSLDNVGEIENVYRNYVNSSETLIPYDAQEEVIKYGVAFALSNNSDVLKQWINHISTGKPRIPFGLKMSCSGGVGKSRAIIPTIKILAKMINPNLDFTFATNTVNQAKALEESTNQNVDLIENILVKLRTSNLNEYANRVLIIDECTHIDIETLTELCKQCEKYNIKPIFSGDVSQSGVVKNIDMAVMFSTPMLTESKRVMSDISRINSRILANIQNSESLRYILNPSDALLYWEDDQSFEGIKFESVNVQYIRDFITKYKLQNQKILIYTDDIEKYENLKSEFPEIVFDIKTSYEEIQGAEWDYVFADVPLIVETNNELGEAYYWKNIYTLFTRHRKGLISSFNVDKGNKQLFQNELSSRKPIVLNISQEQIDNFKQFKLNVLNALNLPEVKNTVTLEVKPSDEGFENPSPKFINYSVIQASPAFLPKFNIPYDTNNESIEKEKIRNILIEGLTDRSKLNMLDQSLQGGEFVLMFKHYERSELDKFGNEWRDEKNIPKIGAWLTYKLGDIDIPFALFHSPYNSDWIPEKAFDATKKLQSLVNWSDFDPNNPSSFVPRYYKLPKSIDFRRTNNLIAIQNYESGEPTIVKWQARNGIIKDSGVDFLNVSVPIYGDTRLTSQQGMVPIKEINDTLSTQKSYYKDIYDELVKLGMINNNKLDEDLYFDDILNIIGTDRNGEFRPKYTPNISGNFITFVQLNTNVNISTKEGALQYWGWVKATNEWLSNILIELKKINISKDWTTVKELLSNSPQGKVSILVFNPKQVKDTNDIKQIISNLYFSDTNKSKHSYNRAILTQIAMMLNKIFDVVNNDKYSGRNKNFINKSDVAMLSEKLNSEIERLNVIQTKSGASLLNTIQTLVSDLFVADKGRDFNANLKFLSELIQEFTELKDLIINIYSTDSIIDEKLVNKFNKDRIGWILPSKLHQYLIEDNQISLWSPVVSEIFADTDATLELERKVVQRNQIHMRVAEDVEYEELTFSSATSEVNTNEDDLHITEESIDMDVQPSNNITKVRQILKTFVQDDKIDEEDLVIFDKCPENAKLALVDAIMSDDHEFVKPMGTKARDKDFLEGLLSLFVEQDIKLC